MADLVQTLAEAPTPVEMPTSPEMRKARLEKALAQIKMGMDVSPVQHWTQGLARLANAGFGGWDMSLLDKEAKAAQQRQMDLINSHPALAGTGGTTEQPSRTASALAGVGPSTLGTAATYGAAPA